MSIKDIFTSFYSWEMFSKGLIANVLATIFVILIWTLTGYIEVGPFPSLGVEVTFYIILGTMIFVMLETLWQILKLICVLIAVSYITLGLRSKSETLVVKSNKLLTKVRSLYEKD